MTPLQQKLEQLNLTTISRHLDQMLAEVTAENLSLAQTLEAIIDREIESRYQRSIERRFCSPVCQLSLPSTAFTLTITSPEFC